MQRVERTQHLHLQIANNLIAMIVGWRFGTGGRISLPLVEEAVMFDAIIRELSQRFGLGDKAKDLVTALLSLIFDPNSGGISGLLARFKQQGLGDLFSSWLGGSTAPPAPINPPQLENVLGSSAIGGISDKLGIPRGTVLSAAAAALPGLIRALTPNGQLPTAIPSSVSALIGGLGGAASTAAARAAGNARAAADTVERGAGLGWLKWLIPVAIVLALGYCMLNRPVPPPVTGAAQNAATATRNAATDAMSSLRGLVPGKYTADELVRALNAMTIHFDTGSANISSDSLDILGVAANALKSSPAGTRVEIGGHTDNTGDPAANMKLSEDRANAVRTKLVNLGVPADLLTAKGYGDTKPVADNSTEDGRAKNRRMEFTVVR
jgi:outer membrane protein OmpA-like peptidoglycan-associated protein/uncharacterized protein YidB (DUF937 family)